MATADLRLGVVTLVATLSANVLTSVVFFAGLAAYHHNKPFVPGTGVLLLVILGFVLALFRVGKPLPERGSLGAMLEWTRGRPSATILVIGWLAFTTVGLIRLVAVVLLPLMVVVGPVIVGSLLGYAYIETK